MTKGAQPPPPRAVQDDAAIDLAGGVDRVMGDHALFARIVERFRRDYRRAAASIRAALAAGDIALAQRLTHNLRGAASMIEARPLQREALALEQALRGADADCERQLGRLDTELDRVLRELDAMLAMQAIRHDVPAVSSLNAADAVARLAALLDTGDGAAVELVEEAHSALAAVLGEERLRAVAAAVNEFDFERALALLDTGDAGPASQPA